MKEEDYVVLEVEEKGKGIKEDVLEKIFEKLLKKKEVGKGKGIGI